MKCVGPSLVFCTRMQPFQYSENPLWFAGDATLVCSITRRVRQSFSELPNKHLRAMLTMFQKWDIKLKQMKTKIMLISVFQLLIIFHDTQFLRSLAQFLQSSSSSVIGFRCMQLTFVCCSPVWPLLSNVTSMIKLFFFTSFLFCPSVVPVLAHRCPASTRCIVYKTLGHA